MDFRRPDALWAIPEIAWNHWLRYITHPNRPSNDPGCQPQVGELTLGPRLEVPSWMDRYRHEGGSAGGYRSDDVIHLRIRARERALIRSVPEGENTAVGPDEPVATSVRCRHNAFDVRNRHSQRR
jgi:hypothetical protein